MNESRYAQQKTVSEHIEELSAPTMKLFGHLRGWFVVCVFIVGVPKVLQLSVEGVKAAEKSVRCTLVDCNAKPEVAPIVQTEQLSDEEVVDRAIRILEKANPGKRIEFTAKKP